MTGPFHRVLTLGIAALCAIIAPTAGAQNVAEALARGANAFDTSASNLIVVLRESRGENREHEALVPYGRGKIQLSDGREVDFQAAWYGYLGDMHVRLVFDSQQTLQSASPDDLARLKLSPEEALKVAVGNLKRRYGSPVETAWEEGLTQVESPITESAAGDLVSSYFLDREFWQGVQDRHPAGVVVAVPRRGGLVYASADDEAAIQNLRFSAAALYSGGPGTRLSSALYLFKAGEWSVYQPPMPRATVAAQ